MFAAKPFVCVSLYAAKRVANIIKKEILMITLTTAEKALKTYYLDALTHSLNVQVNPLLAKLERTSSDVWGKEVRKTVFSGVNGGFGAGTEDGELPVATNQDYVQLTATLKNLYGSLEISDKAMRASSSREGAVVNLLEAEMQNLIDCARFNFGRMLYGDGSGVVANVVSVSGNTITVDSVKYIMEGMLVDIVDDDSEKAVVTARRVTAVNRADKTITVDGASLGSTVSAGHYVTVQNSYNRELGGLGLIFGNSERLYGVSRKTYGWLKPNKFTATDITGAAIQKAIDAVEDLTGAETDFIVCSAGVKRAYINYLQSNSCNLEYATLASGHKALTYGGIPLVSDRFCPDGTMYVLHTPDIKLYQLCDWDWLQDDDGRVLRQMAGKPVYSATIAKYAELMCHRPSAQACITGITEA